MGIKVLSLYDGMSCASIALKNLGIEVDEYISYEIDKYAIKVTQHNFPNVIQKGDVYGADFTQYEGVDWLTGGFPCTKFSIAQKNDRETEPYSGLGWELFMHFKRAIDEAKPKFFLAENNKSMAKPIRDEISRLLGFEPVLINSALVSAQNRQRLYWVGRRNEDGTYSKVGVGQPEDKGILLRDVLDGAVAWQEKSYALTTRRMGAIPEDTLKKHRHTMVAEPVCVAQRGRYAESGEIIQHYEPREDGKTNAITTVQKDNAVCEPVRVGTIENNAQNPDHDSKQYRVYSPDGKSTTICGQGGGVGAKTGLYAVPINGRYVATNAIGAKGALPIYEVLNGLITIKDKQYPIKLADGFYIIRKLTVSECMRLQTVPEWYDFSVISNSQAYKCLGNGWTVDVITHLIQSAQIESAPTEAATTARAEQNY